MHRIENLAVARTAMFHVELPCKWHANCAYARPGLRASERGMLTSISFFNAC